LLRQGGVPVHTPSVVGRTALHYAMSGLFRLREEGKDVVTDVSAIRRLCTYIVETTPPHQLLASLEIPDRAGHTPLDLALNCDPCVVWPMAGEGVRSLVSLL